MGTLPKKLTIEGLGKAMDHQLDNASDASSNGSLDTYEEAIEAARDLAHDLVLYAEQLEDKLAWFERVRSAES